MELATRVELASPASTVEETLVLKPQVVEEVLRRLAGGAAVSALAAEYGVDRKTIRAWRSRGGYRPREPRAVSHRLDEHTDWLTARAPEVAFNAAVLHRELVERGYAGSAQQVLRFVRPLRIAARRPTATVRFETAPGQQAQVDFGQRQVWIRDTAAVAHVFVFTLGYSRRLFAQAFTHERLDAVLEGHEQGFRHFGGVPAQIVVDNAKPVVLSHRQRDASEVSERPRHVVVWHPAYTDFAQYYGFEPWAHWPYRPQTKGKTESGVKYVQRNALAGKRFRDWTHVNEWLLEWATTIADRRVHGTTHEVPEERFSRVEQAALTPVGTRALYARERLQFRTVAQDSLVAIGGSRYSVPWQYAGAQVSVRELLGSYEISCNGEVIAQHTRQGRHKVVMERPHYAGLLRTGDAARTRQTARAAMPQHDPRYPAIADVEVRDLSIYDEIAGELVAGGAS